MVETSKSECILSRRHTFCQGGGSLIFQDAQLFCQGSRCFRENKSDKPNLRGSAESKKTVSSRSCEPGGCRLCFCNEKCYNGNKHISERKTIAVLIVMTCPHDTAIVPNNDYCSTFSSKSQGRNFRNYGIRCNLSRLQ